MKYDEFQRQSKLIIGQVLKEVKFIGDNGNEYVVTRIVYDNRRGEIIIEGIYI